MEELTLEGVLSEFNNYIKAQNNYTPTYFKDILNFLKEDIEEMKNILKDKNFNFFIFFKHNYIENSIFNKTKYQQEIKGILKDYLTDNFEISNNGKERVEYIKNYFNIPQKAEHDEINFQNKKTKEVTYFSFVLMDSCSSKIENIFCIFHEYCHVLQNYFYFKKQPLYIKETQADVFGYCATIVKLLQNNKTDLLEHILMDSTTNNNITHGYFSFPIIKEIIDNLNQAEFLKKFTDENNNIQYNTLFDFSLENLNQAEFLKKFTDENNNIQYNTLFDFSLKKVQEKLKQYGNDIQNSKIYQNELEESYNIFTETDKTLSNYFYTKKFLLQDIRITYPKKYITLKEIEYKFNEIKKTNTLNYYDSINNYIENFIQKEKNLE